jgi:Trehalose receptor
MFLFLAEHVLFLATAISDNHLQLVRCTPKSQDFWENFLSRYRPHLHYNIPYSAFELPLYEVSFNLNLE